MASVFDIAKYILQKQGELSTMKLQKLCYYSQAWSLVWDDRPLFNEDFQAWANGPVCKELFLKFKGMFSVDADNELLNSYLSYNSLDYNQKNTIDTVLAHYGDKNAQWLSTLTHMEDPWKDARGRCPAGAVCDNVITKESMAIYYGSL